MAATQENRRVEEFEALARAGNGNGNGHRNGADVRERASEAGAAMLASASAHTAQHSDDVVVIADALCDKLAIKGGARADLLAAARLHDIGKTSVPAEVVDKAGPLTDEEWDLMKHHTIAGERILSSVPELTGIAAIVRNSHERWDGGGYPDGLSGEEIPLASRVIFCADAFHAIRCDRPYREGRPATEALAEVRRNSGSQFDPKVVSALVAVTRELRLVPAGGRFGRKSRLGALLLVVAVGATGSAVADLGLVDRGGSSAPEHIVPPVSPCVNLNCPALLDLPAGRRLKGTTPGVSNGARANRGNRDEAPIGSGDGASPAPSIPPSDTPSEVGSANNSPGGNDAGTGNGNGSGNGANGDSDTTTATGGSGGSKPSHPHGGPPGQTGQHPQGGPPGQTGQHPQGGPPGQTETPGSSTAPGEASDHPHGGPPGQTKKQ